MSLINNPEIANKILSLPDDQKVEILSLLNELDKARDRERCQNDFLEFVKSQWPAFIEGEHHKIMARAFEKVARGECKRMVICVAPRHGKSELTSYMLPAWFLGNYPNKKVIQCSHTAELAVGFGRKVRNLVDSEDYRKVFTDVELRADSKAAGRWSTNQNGEYFAIGVGGAVTGKGADLLIIDDPHALEVSTPIPTPNGFVALGDLKVGDEVFGPDGWPTKVVAKSQIYKDRELYEVKTYDGEVILADAKHLWNVRTSTRIKDPYRNLATEELLKQRSSPFMIPRHSAVQYNQRKLPIDPWVLGAWLGDGTSSLGRMTAHPDDAIFMRAEFKRRGYETTNLKDKFNFGVTGLWTQLKALNLINNKHIPEQYLTSSFLQRMDLLCGLIDTDGNVTKDGQCSFHGKDKKLVDQVVELLHSLGRKCQRRTYLTKGNHGDCEMHRVTFKLKDCALMPRKRYRTRTTHDKQHRSITVQKTNQRGAVQCITVEREDGLFLAGRGYVVTHNSEQEAALGDPGVYDKTYEWYTSGPRQRLQPGGAIIIVQTRWHQRDLVGRVLKSSIERGSTDEWEVIELPAIMPSGNPLWPEFWSIKELEAIRAELPLAKWQAQYQQDPTSEEGALVKRDWWRVWEKTDPPVCDFVIQSWDTAFTKKQTSDFSACTTWGVFKHPNPETGVVQSNIILLDAIKERMEFPELKKRAMEMYRQFSPDAFIVEAKAAGAPLIYELRAMGIPVSEFTPSRGNDKIARVNAVSDLFSSGVVWAPQKRWAEEVVEEFAAFPNAEHDDLVDSSTQALLRFRQGGFIAVDSDEREEKISRRRFNYY
jgi:predicted phage terminase large subunit-like protein